MQTLPGPRDGTGRPGAPTTRPRNENVTDVLHGNGGRTEQGRSETHAARGPSSRAVTREAPGAAGAGDAVLTLFAPARIAVPGPPRGPRRGAATARRHSWDTAGPRPTPRGQRRGPESAAGPRSRRRVREGRRVGPPAPTVLTPPRPVPAAAPARPHRPSAETRPRRGPADRDARIPPPASRDPLRHRPARDPTTAGGRSDADSRALRAHGRPPHQPRAPPARTHLPGLHRSSPARTAGRRPGS